MAILATVVALGAGALALGLGGMIGGGPARAAPAPRFVDESATAGVAITYDGPLELGVGGGVSAFDCNRDGRTDLFVAGGANPAGLFRNATTAPGSIHFDRIADPATDLPSVTGAYPLDVDGDSNVDLVLLRAGENVVLRGLGDCRFERANESWGLDGGTRDTMAFSATWEPGEAWPTLAFGNYVDQHIDDPKHWCEPNELVRPAGTGATAWGPPTRLEPGFCTLSMLFSSWDGSGRADLRVSNDRHYYDQAVGQEQLWRIDPGTPPRLYTAADGWGEVQVEGMGIASQDLTGDGLPEVYLTSQAANHLMTLAGGSARPTFRDIGLDRGTNIPHPVTGTDTALPSTSWHPEFADVNNDGFLDLLVTKGNVGAQGDFAHQDPSNLLLGQADGTFAEATDAAGLVRFDKGRGAVLADLDLDGNLDLVESFYGAPVLVARNTGLAGDGGGTAANQHWLAFRLRQPGPNVDAIGATVEVHAGGRAFDYEMTSGGGHAGGQLDWVHVGLGAATNAEIRVRWPGGAWSSPATVAADGFTIVDRDSGLQPWTP